MADRGDDIACTADYIFGLASTEFQVSDCAVTGTVTGTVLTVLTVL